MKKAHIIAGSLALLAACDDGDLASAADLREGTSPEPTSQAAPPTSEAQPSPSGETSPAPQTGSATREGTAPQAEASPRARFTVAGVSCRPGAQVSSAISRMVEFADPNSDGKVTHEEARAMSNFLVGGFFFRADENGDGTITPQEGTEARKEFLVQQPALAALLQAAREAGAKAPFLRLAQLLDIESGQPVNVAEAREAARAALNDVYAVADSNKDGAITLGEARDASVEGAQALGQTMFRQADADDNGKLTNEEFQQALLEPAKVAFDLADANDNGLTEDEAAMAMTNVVKQLGMPTGQR